MSGAGKSTVCGVFRQRGFAVTDCDGIARKTAENRDFLSELKSRFPDDLLNADGSLNRGLTAKTIFTDAEKRRLYNQIIFPYIIFEVVQEVKSAGDNVLLDAPTLFDSGLDIICTKTVGVIASPELCAARITKRDGISRERAEERLSAQREADFFKRKCGYIIENNGGLSDFTEQAEKVTDKLKGTI